MSDEPCKKGPVYRRIALIGTGLIGGSLGIRIRERRLVEEIAGYDRNGETLALALERGAVDRAAATAIDAVRGAELVVLAVPVLSTPAVIEEAVPVLEAGTVITDVGSTKDELMRLVGPIIPCGVHFIGGHPMAGSEESGIRGADPAILENAIYVLSPAEGVPESVTARLYRLVEATGAQPLVVDPARHDRAVALVSHLPHLLAAALVNSVAGAADEELLLTLAAGGFRDTTRIALGDPEVWRDIFISNRRLLLGAVEALEENLKEIGGLLARSSPGELHCYLERARRFRRKVTHRGRGILPDVFEVVVLVPDTPGIIGRLATLLGDKEINIASIEIIHVRELEGGSILLGFRDAGQQLAALELLRQEGYRAHRRD